MTCHYRLGATDRAIQLYNQCRMMLVMSLGIKPSEKTEEVYRKLHKQWG